MRKKCILILLLMAVCNILFSQSTARKLSKQMIVPAILIGYGLTTFNGNGFPSDYDVKEFRYKHFANFHTRIDDILPFAPVALTYSLDMLGIKCKSDFTNRSIIFAKAAVISLLTVNIIKYSAQVLRPDSSANNSFPSGHTAFAFAMATVMHHELNEHSAWWSVLGYGCATGVGAMRILNNRHWFNDVLIGAGIGLASGHIASTTHQYKWKRFMLHAQLMPTVFNNGYGIAFSKKF